jgi:hypothetical protein
MKEKEGAGDWGLGAGAADIVRGVRRLVALAAAAAVVVVRKWRRDKGMAVRGIVVSR